MKGECDVTRKEKFFAYALAVLIGIMVALLLLAFTNYPAYAEEMIIDPHIVYTRYDGAELFGIAEVPDGEYYAKVTMYIEGYRYFILFVPIQPDGTFQSWLWADCYYMTVSVTEYPLPAECACGTIEEYPVLRWE